MASSTSPIGAARRVLIVYGCATVGGGGLDESGPYSADPRCGALPDAIRCYRVPGFYAVDGAVNCGSTSRATISNP
jgi:hypothetical protein